jgi:hypothetical protein
MNHRMVTYPPGYLPCPPNPHCPPLAGSAGKAGLYRMAWSPGRRTRRRRARRRMARGQHQRRSFASPRRWPLRGAAEGGQATKLVTCPPNPPKAGKAGLYRMAGYLPAEKGFAHQCGSVSSGWSPSATSRRDQANTRPTQKLGGHSPQGEGMQYNTRASASLVTARRRRARRVRTDPHCRSSAGSAGK